MKKTWTQASSPPASPSVAGEAEDVLVRRPDALDELLLGDALDGLELVAEQGGALELQRLGRVAPSAACSDFTTSSVLPSRKRMVWRMTSSYSSFVQ